VGTLPKTPGRQALVVVFAGIPGRYGIAPVDRVALGNDR
jgi:hypothetical protein